MKRIAFKMFAHGVLAALLSAYAAAQGGAGSQSPPPPPRPLPTPAPAVNAGTITGSIYANDYFGMQLTIPEGWNIYDAQGRQVMLEHGRQLMTTHDQRVQAQMDAGVARTVNLLTFSKLPQNQAGPGNAIFACGAELVPTSVIKTGGDYLTNMKQLLPYSKMTYEIEQDVGTEKINGAEFGVLALKIESNGATIGQKYYAITKREYALFCVSTYTNEGDRQVMDKAMNSIKFR
ncbi:MAG: hypothetical protein LC754_13605 [Acidobacteria bacterium]|nr:hypothetical protein [Acidobacteriota bacterium]